MAAEISKNSCPACPLAADRRTRRDQKRVLPDGFGWFRAATASRAKRLDPRLWRKERYQNLGGMPACLQISLAVIRSNCLWRLTGITRMPLV